eukprot:COSAG05_NODE_13351_length_433_cov_1.284431_1_plen_57_part_10
MGFAFEHRTYSNTALPQYYVGQCTNQTWLTRCFGCVNICLRVRVDIIGHLKSCMTDI